MIASAEDVMRRICGLRQGNDWRGDTEQERALVHAIDEAAIKLARTTTLSFAQAVGELWTLADAGMAVDGAVVAVRAGVPAKMLADALRERS
jgi:hypothetical protein